MIERVEVDERSLARLVSALRAEADGKELKRDLVQELRAVAQPALEAARSAVLAMPGNGQDQPGLRVSVARQTVIRVHLSGDHPGVAIKAKKTGMPRGFNNAPKRLNSRKGWRRQVYGGAWVTQLGRPGWFDDTISRYKPAAQRAAQKAMDAMAERIDRRTKG